LLLVRGPRRVCGGEYAAVGRLRWEIVLASIPYGLLCAAVLMGKHIDKIAWDAPAGTRTLPVVVGEARARRLTQGLMAAFYALVAACVIVGALPWPALLAFAALPALRKVWARFEHPRPDAPPERFP